MAENGEISMSRAENRHHKQRVVRNRIKKIKVKWRCSATNNEEWVIKTAKGKDNPFTRCSCWMCQDTEHEHAENKRDRKKAKHEVINTETED